MEETWKDIKGYEGMYQVSELGNVRSVDRSYKDVNGKLYNLKGRVLKLSISNGYLSLNLNNKGKKRFCVHRLVAETFLDNPENKPEVNHINGNKLDNRLANLEWCTKSENTLHAYSIGLMTPNNIK